MTIPTFTLPVPLHRYRVMFNDGECIDVIAPGDSSTMREFALKQRQTDAKVTVMVSGVADLGLVKDDFADSAQALREFVHDVDPSTRGVPPE